MDNRRRQIYVKEGDHRGLLTGAIILILVLVVVASGLFYILANRNLEKATYRAHFEALHNTMQMLLPWLVLVNIIGLVVVIILAIFFTHRIAGPTFHLIRDLKALGEGDLTINTTFRKGDRLKDLAAAMSLATEQLRQKIADIKTQISELLKVTSDEAGVKQRLGEINRTLDKLKT